MFVTELIFSNDLNQGHANFLVSLQNDVIPLALYSSICFFVFLISWKVTVLDIQGFHPTATIWNFVSLIVVYELQNKCDSSAGILAKATSPAAVHLRKPLWIFQSCKPRPMRTSCELIWKIIMCEIENVSHISNLLFCSRFLSPHINFVFVSDLSACTHLV